MILGPYTMFFFFFFAIINGAPVSVSRNRACTVTVAAGDGPGLVQAVAEAGPGATVCVPGGVYDVGEPLMWNATDVQVQGPWCGTDPRGGTADGALPLAVGAQPRPAVISGWRRNAASLAVMDRDGARLCGFTLERNNNTDDMVHVHDSARVVGAAVDFNVLVSPGEEGVQLRACTDCRASYNVVIDAGEDGINVCCNSRDVLLEFNEVWRSRSDEAALQVEDSVRVEVRDNAIMDSLETGLLVGRCNSAGSSGSLSMDIIVERNLIVDARERGLVVDGARSVQVLNNVIRGTGTGGGSSGTPAAALTVRCNGTRDIELSNNLVAGGGAPNTRTLVLGANSPDSAYLGPSGRVVATLTANCLESGGGVIVASDNVGSTDAANNWWGPTGGVPVVGGSNERSNIITVSPAAPGSQCPYPVPELNLRRVVVGTTATAPPTAAPVGVSVSVGMAPSMAPAPAPVLLLSPSTSPSPSPGAPGLAGGTVAAIVLVLLVLMMGGGAGFFYLWRKKRTGQRMGQRTGHTGQRPLTTINDSKSNDSTRSLVSVSSEGHTAGGGRRSGRRSSRRRSQAVSSGGGSSAAATTSTRHSGHFDRGQYGPVSSFITGSASTSSVSPAYGKAPSQGTQYVPMVNRATTVATYGMVPGMAPGVAPGMAPPKPQLATYGALAQATPGGGGGGHTLPPNNYGSLSGGVMGGAGGGGGGGGTSSPTYGPAATLATPAPSRGYGQLPNSSSTVRQYA